MNYNEQFDQKNEHFLFLHLVRLELRSASESIQLVQVVWVGPNWNQVWLMKSSASEPVNQA